MLYRLDHGHVRKLFGIPLQRGCSFSSHLLTYSIISFYQDGFSGSFYTLGCNSILLSLPQLFCSSEQLWLNVCWLLYTFDIPLLFTTGSCVCWFVYGHFHTFWHCKLLPNHFGHFLPQSQNQPFLQGALGPFTGEQYQKLRSEHEVCSVPQGHHCLQTLSSKRTRGYVCVYELVYRYISVNVSMCNHLNLYEAAGVHRGLQL